MRLKFWHPPTTNGGGSVTGGSIKLVRKTVDESVNNSNVIQADDELLLAVAVGEKWLIELFVVIDCVSITPDFKWTLTAPDGAYFVYGTTGAQQGSTAVFDKFTDVGAGYDMDSIITDIGCLHVRAWIVNGVNAGNVQFNWAQKTAHASNVTVKAGSCLIGFKLD